MWSRALLSSGSNYGMGLPHTKNLNKRLTVGICTMDIKMHPVSGNPTVKSGTNRRAFLTGVCAAALSTGLPIGAFALEMNTPETLILDPQTREWVRYTPQVAQRFYRVKGSIPEEFRRQIVPFRSLEEPGTVVVDSDKHFLYLVQPDQMAIRYGIGVGREGFGWAGIVQVGRTAEWPTWTPPAEMVERDPLAAKWKDGMPGGPTNPLGARALYLYEDGRDTIYRIHGTSEPWSIGLNVSSGCIRLLNDDVTDLHARVAVGAKVVVLFEDATQFEGVL